MPIKFRNDITQKELIEVLEYNQFTGIFKWKTSRTNSIKVGDIAGSTSTRKYLRISLHKKSYQCHRLAWLYMTGKFPKEVIGHKDGNPTNNKWENLRLASQKENVRNKIMKANSSGYRGVYKNQTTDRFHAKCKLDGKNIYLGSYDTTLKASSIYENFIKIHHKDFYYKLYQKN